MLRILQFCLLIIWVSNFIEASNSISNQLEYDINVAPLNKTSSTSSSGIVDHVKRIVNDLRSKSKHTIQNFRVRNRPWRFAVKLNMSSSSTIKPLRMTFDGNEQNFEATTEETLHYYGALSKRFREEPYKEPEIIDA